MIIKSLQAKVIQNQDICFTWFFEFLIVGPIEFGQFKFVK